MREGGWTEHPKYIICLDKMFVLQVLEKYFVGVDVLIGDAINYRKYERNRCLKDFLQRRGT